MSACFRLEGELTPSDFLTVASNEKPVLRGIRRRSSPPPRLDELIRLLKRVPVHAFLSRNNLDERQLNGIHVQTVLVRCGLQSWLLPPQPAFRQSIQTHGLPEWSAWREGGGVARVGSSAIVGGFSPEYLGEDGSFDEIGPAFVAFEVTGRPVGLPSPGTKTPVQVRRHPLPLRGHKHRRRECLRSWFRCGHLSWANVLGRLGDGFRGGRCGCVVGGGRSPGWPREGLALGWIYRGCRSCGHLESFRSAHAGNDLLSDSL